MGEGEMSEWDLGSGTDCDNELYSCFVTSHNTPGTLLTNFWIVLGHTVTSIHILRFLELMFRTQTWMQPCDHIHHHATCIIFWITEDFHL